MQVLYGMEQRLVGRSAASAQTLVGSVEPPKASMSTVTVLLLTQGAFTSTVCFPDTLGDDELHNHANFVTLIC